MCVKTKSIDPDQTPPAAASDQGLNCLLRSLCPNTLDKYGRQVFYARKGELLPCAGNKGYRYSCNNRID